MKTFAFAIVCLLFCFLVSSHVEAVSLPGWYCADVVVNGQDEGVFKFKTKSSGSGYYTMQGSPVTVGAGPYMFGSAQIVGNQVIFTFNTASAPDVEFDDFDVGIGRVVMDVKTLSGSMKYIGKYFSGPPDNLFSDRYREGTFTRVTCPKK